MADIELVIKIHEDAYESAKNGTLNEIQSMYICGSVVEGTPLPKNHGDLIDRSMLPTNYITDDDIADASAIIKAHKES